MVSLFSAFFLKTSKNRTLFFAVTGILITLFSFSAANISFEEDITKVISSSSEHEKYIKVLDKFKLLDRIVFKVSFSKCDNENCDHTKLSNYAGQFIEKMKESNESRLIKSFSSDKMKVNESIVYNHFYKFLPVYLEDNDYKYLEEMSDPLKIEEMVGKLYRNIVSPAGMISASFIRKDPFGLTFRALEKLNTLNPDENFEVIDGHIFTTDKKNLIFFIEPSGSANESADNSSLIKKMDSIIDELNEQSDHEVYGEYYGGLPIAVGSAARIKADVVLSSILAFFLVFFILFFYFRKISVIPLIFLPALFGGLSAIAAAYFFRGTISAISLGVTSVLLGISIDYSIHIISHALKSETVEQAIKDVSLPMVISSTTTVAAFSCLMFLDSPILNDLGLLGAVSIFAAALFSLTVLPHLIFFVKKRYPSIKTEPDCNEKNFKQKTFFKYRFIIPLLLVVTGIALIFSKETGFEEDLNKINHVSPKLEQAMNNIDDINNVSGKTIYLIFKGDSLDRAINIRERVDSEIEALITSGKVKAITDISGLIYSQNFQHEKILKWHSFWDEERKGEVKRLLLEKGEKYGFKEETFSQFFQLIERSYNPVEPEKLTDFAAEMFKDWFILDENEAMVASLIKIGDNDSSEIYETFKEIEGVTVFDRGYLVSSFINRLRFDFENLLLYSFFVVLFILIFLTGRIELGIAAIIPVIISWIWTIGIMGVAGIKFNIVNVIIVTFIFGLGIDYVVFIMRAKMQEYTYGTKTCFLSYRSSIILSCITTVTGVGVLFFAVHPAIRSIAFIAVAGMLSSLINALVFAPAIFDWMMINQKKKKAPPHTFVVFVYTFLAYTSFVLASLTISSIGFAIFTTIPFNFARKQRKYLYHTMIRYAAGSVIIFAPHISLKMKNPFKEDFKKPSVIIVNHESFLDILMMLYMKTKIVMVTKDWVNNSPVFGRLVRFADFFTVTEGYEKMAPRLQQVIDDGYSIVVFPEGTRSEDGNLRRFHKGAFFLAEMLKLDIVPIVLHGTGHCIKKGEFSVRASDLSYNVLKRIEHGSKEYGETYQEKYKNISKMYKQERNRIYEELGTVDFYKDRLLKNFVYKGPDIEWYSKIKIKLEDYYRFFEEIMPRKCKIYDLGCGMGFLTYMLSLTSKERVITGVDYDNSKISVAENCFLKNNQTNFVNGDIIEIGFDKADVFIMNDVLHYFDIENQKKVIVKCAESLNDGGFIILRDGDAGDTEKHKNTAATEKYSTGLGFNRTNGKLSFISMSDLEKISFESGLDIAVLKSQHSTSNRIYKLTKKADKNV
jgi:uncharacterized protein